ncbi:osmolarity response regulator [Caballeronia temeraria]|uniref:Osmolarity response regulator n=1 Tax=Caballeronia temeraria TaxID=1777137 RepID=A0A158CKZ4_9BURK|nr:response regulator [Caballeronia temeraria]SAK82940.1 osmolarity response regulator [Caballeronia temeraria]
MSTSVLIVDDDPAVRDLLRRFFNAQGIDVSVLHDGAGLRRRLELERPSIVVLDIMMPDTDGLRALRDLRAAGEDIPVIFVTGCDSVPQKIAGLQSGADDYLAKPFDPHELLARIEAVLRRRTAAPSRPEPAPRERFGRFEVDFVSRSLLRGDERIALRDSEFALLKVFIKNPYKVLSRVLIHDLVHRDDLPFRDRGLDVPIWRLRRLIEDDPSHPRHVQTVRGQGYVFVPDADDSPSGWIEA